MKAYGRNTPLMQNIQYFLKWTLISVIIGLLVGFIGSVFGHGVTKATALWNAHHWTLFLMPVAGLIIVFCYRLAHEEKNRGTDMVLESISAKEEISVATGPLIFLSTVLSHAVSASAGREGAALQLIVPPDAAGDAVRRRYRLGQGNGGGQHRDALHLPCPLRGEGLCAQLCQVLAHVPRSLLRDPLCNRL